MEEEEKVLTKRERRELAKEEKRQERSREESSSKTKKILVWVLIALALGWLGYKGYKYFTAPVPEVTRIPIAVVESDRVKGDIEAKTTLIEYGDFQCPACGAYYPLVKDLLKDIPQGFRVVYRHYPLTEVHKNALPAAKAAEAAGLQDKFWEMHDILFERQKDWSDLGNAKEKFLEYAKELGLDEEKFLNDFESSQVQDKISAEIASGNSLGVNSTPTFYLNGAKISPRSYDEFKKVVENEIKGYSLE